MSPTRLSALRVYALLLVFLICAEAASAATLTTVATFTGANGSNPAANLLLDASGNLYGTASSDGPDTFGTVFKLDASNNFALSTLVSFNAANGASPYGALIADASGNLYGTSSALGPGGTGTVFKLDAANNYALTTLAAFNSANGTLPYAGVTADAAGNLFGTTLGGGSHFRGTVYRLDASNNYALTTLINFNGTDGWSPQAGVILDAAGNVYGASSLTNTVFRLDASNNYALTTLATFDGTNGSGPEATLLADAAGNLYGTTTGGGTGANAHGTVYKLNASQNFSLTDLATFNGTNGASPLSTLLADAAGNLYGTTREGGAFGNGTVFKLDAANGYALTTLVDFDDTNGATPQAGLVADPQGNLYGTTAFGGDSGDGTVFELSGAGFVTTVPEPGSLTLPLAAAGVALIARRFGARR